LSIFVCTAGSSRSPDVDCILPMVTKSVVQYIYHGLTWPVTSGTSTISIDWFEYGLSVAGWTLRDFGNQCENIERCLPPETLDDFMMVHTTIQNTINFVDPVVQDKGSESDEPHVFGISPASRYLLPFG
jgi:hypothetical protein